MRGKLMLPKFIEIRAARTLEILLQHLRSHKRKEIFPRAS